MWEVVLDALIDSAKAAPFLLLIYLLIEFLESNKRAKNRTVKLLNGGAAPLVAGSVGLIPQCGFSVIATDLYCQNYLKLGTLIAFFVATSDEALPILLTNSKTVGIVWVVLLVKILYAIVLGYLINLFDRRKLVVNYNLDDSRGCCHHELGDNSHEADDDCDDQGDEHNHAHAHEHHKHNGAKHGNVKARAFWNFVKHPLCHSAKIFLYIFVVNVVFGLLLFYTEQSILQFTSTLGFFQCFFTALIGLVPNCASSVIITGMYTEGIINFSALLAGLVSNSGIALAILFKQRRWKRNLSVVAIMYFAGVLMGAFVYILFPPIALL